MFPQTFAASYGNVTLFSVTAFTPHERTRF